MTEKEARPATHTTHDAIMPLFCPTEQVISVIPNFFSHFNPIPTVHGVVFAFHARG